MSSGHQRITWRRNIAENFNRLSRVHERYRQTTDGRQHIANSLKILLYKIYKYNIGDLPKSARHVQGNQTC